jgi:hypothetical protein
MNISLEVLIKTSLNDFLDIAWNMCVIINKHVFSTSPASRLDLKDKTAWLIFCSPYVFFQINALAEGNILTV